MGLFENERMKTQIELERQLKKIEVENDIKMMQKEIFVLETNILFAVKIQLINQQIAREYLVKLNKIKEKKKYIDLYRREYGLVSDDFESPLERAFRYNRMSVEQKIFEK